MPRLSWVSLALEPATTESGWKDEPPAAGPVVHGVEQGLEAEYHAGIELELM